MKFDVLKMNQIKKYSSFEIPLDKLNEFFDIACKKESNEINISIEFDKIVDKYILNEIKNDNIDMQIKVIEKYNYIKTISKKNIKYRLDDRNTNKIYEKAIDILKYKYDDNITMSRNIINNMKYIINNNYIENDMKFLEDGEYDISFLKEYINKFKIDKRKLIEELQCDPIIFNKLLNNEKKTNKDFVDNICIILGADNYEDLKKLVINEEKYSFDFMKEYVRLYDIDTSELAKTFYCGINKVEDVINGKILLKKSLVDVICSDKNYKNYDEFKKDILQKIERKKNNLLNKNKEKKKNTILLDSINKNELFEMLELKNMDYRTSLITILLFSGIVDKTIKELSEYLCVSEMYILMVYKNDLSIIKEKLKRKNPNVTLIYENKMK